jgi:hypothetical protein
MSDKLYEVAQTAQQKFYHGLLTVSLGTLALSIQFSPKMGKVLWWSLISSWIMLFVSSLAGGWRLSRETVYLRHNYGKATAEHHSAKAMFDHEMNRNQKFIAQLTQVQIWSLILGLSFGLSFAIANYLNELN